MSTVNFRPAIPSCGGHLIQLLRSTKIDSQGNNQIGRPAHPAPPEPQLPHRIPVREGEEVNAEFLPHMLAQLEDELARSRKREAFWISVIIHIVFVLLIIFSPQLLPNWAQPHLLRAEDLARTKEATFIELPQDAQKPPEKVHTNKLSDKNRIAQTTHPQIDKKTLDEMRGNQMPPSPQAAPQMPQGAPPAQTQGAQRSFQQQSVPPEEQPNPNLFRMPGSAGDIIAEAARNAARRGTAGGGLGYGLGSTDQNRVKGGFNILSDTQGVDFGPYLARIRRPIMMNGYLLAPESVRPPLMKHGRVIIRFFIMPDGSVKGMNIESSSGDVSIDRAAFGTILASAPFPPLPREFHGPYLELLGGFYYNPTTGELEQFQ